MGCSIGHEVSLVNNRLTPGAIGISAFSVVIDILQFVQDIIDCPVKQVIWQLFRDQLE
jgi:hypothetical protein